MSGAGVPPEVLEAMGSAAQAGPMPGAPGSAAEGLEDPTGGAEAVAQSDVAKTGLAAWKRVQAGAGTRPEGSDMKALIMYVLTEGMAAPQAPEIAAFLKSKGVNLPGIGNQNDLGDEE